MKTIGDKKKLEVEARRASRCLGLSRAELDELALQYYLASLSKELSFHKELADWEKASDELWAHIEYAEKR